ncbi:MAG: hypothetical protein MK180_01150 [Rhodobacteraceae bacterium]|nr:hypothetical protein [Paracoccaceae bacterium]
MSNTDSFIEEVTEEVRRDKLYGLLKRYGWIAAVAVVALVGGTAWNEYRKGQAEALAQARGDAIEVALSERDAATRAAALGELAENGVVEAYLAASEQEAAGDTDAAVATLTALAETADLPALYRDLAQIKRLSIDTTITGEERAIVLSALAQPGAPYRTIAEEYRALDAIEQGETAAALSTLQAILQDAEATNAQRSRVAQLVVALGETPELANSVLGDTQDLATE